MRVSDFLIFFFSPRSYHSQGWRGCSKRRIKNDKIAQLKDKLVKHICDNRDGEKSAQMCRSSCSVDPQCHLPNVSKHPGRVRAQIRCFSLHVSQVLNCELVEGVTCLHPTAACFSTPPREQLVLRPGTLTPLTCTRWQ